MLMRITVHNRGPEAATLHVLPQLWLPQHLVVGNGAAEAAAGAATAGHVEAHHDRARRVSLVRGRSGPALLFTDNETNTRRLFSVSRNAGYVKDAFHERVVHGHVARSESRSTRARRRQRGIGSTCRPAARSRFARDSRSRRSQQPFADFDATFAARVREADEFYADIQHDMADADRRLVQRQAFAGMIWSKQFFYYDVPRVAEGRRDADRAAGAAQARPQLRLEASQQRRHHLDAGQVGIPVVRGVGPGVPLLPLALIDAEFAKEQLVLLTREWYMHPNGQMPAYEWAFGDVNPPVHAWATWRVFQIDRKQRGDDGDLQFLERVFHKLLLNFTWWVNRKDAEGRNVFQGGFLGLDNIGVFDRSAPLPTGGHIDQADGTSWMAMYALNLMRIALELAQHNHVYEDIATKFFEHFLHIAEAMSNIGEDGVGLWDDAGRVLLRRAAPARRPHDCR